MSGDCVWPRADDVPWPAAEVHVWCSTFESHAASDDQRVVLSDDERARADGFVQRRDRDWFVARRATLRRLLGRYLGIEAAAVRLVTGPRGKPVLANPSSRGPLAFNVAHSHGLVLYAMTSGRRVGVDVELLRQIAEIDAIGVRHFSAVAHARLQSAAPASRAALFFELWTQHEAALKARGLGLEEPGEADIDAIGLDDEWPIRALAPAPGFVGAVCVEGADVPLRCWTEGGLTRELERGS